MLRIRAKRDVFSLLCNLENYSDFKLLAHTYNIKRCCACYIRLLTAAAFATSLKMEFYQTLEKHLAGKDLDEFRRVFYDKQNAHHLNEFSWDIALLLITSLSASEEKESVSHLACLREANVYLCQNAGNSRELYLVYLQNAASYFLKSNDTFILLVELVELLLMRTTPKFLSHSLNSAVRLFNSYLSKLSKPNNEIVYERYILFLERLASFTECNNNKEKETHAHDNDKSKLKLLLTRLLVNLFDDHDDLSSSSSPPLSLNIDLDKKHETENVKSLINDNKNNTRTTTSSTLVYSHRVCRLITKLNRNIVKLILDLERDEDEEMSNDNDEDDDDDDGQDDETKINLNRLALSSFVYFSFVSAVEQSPIVAAATAVTVAECIPLVYEKLFVFLALLKPINRLLSQASDQVCLKKGLALLSTWLPRQTSESFVAEHLLELEHVTNSLELLFRVSIYASDPLVRRQSTECLRVYFLKFPRAGRYEFLKFYLHKPVDDSAQSNMYKTAYLIYLFKEELNECFTHNDGFYFGGGEHFKSLFNLIFNSSLSSLLPPNRQFRLDNDSIVENSAKIIASLNLLRFILLKDRCQNRTGIFQLVTSASFLYLHELRNEITLTRRYYDAEMRKSSSSVDSTSGRDSNGSDTFQVLTVDNQVIREPSEADKRNSVHMALQTVDIIESLSVRCAEILTDEIKHIK
jgi:hypothetical protein